MTTYILKLQIYIEPLLEISREAAAAILKVYEDPKQTSLEYKDDRSPLTAADKAANDVICKSLMNLDASFPIISEENKEIPFEERKDYAYCWVVDPLDGTKEFLKRNGEFTVNIALLQKNLPVLGFIHIPVTGETYYGVKDHGAFRFFERKTTRLSCAFFSFEDKGLKIACSRSHLNDATKSFLNQFKEYSLVPSGSSLKFLTIARGESHFYPRLGPTMEWDTAAAQIILEEAGGQILHYETRKPLNYNKPNLLNPNFIALGKADTDELPGKSE